MGKEERKAARAEQAACDAATRELVRARESFTGVRYLGGWPDFDWSQKLINVVFEPTEIRFGDPGHRIMVPVDDLTGLEIEGPDAVDRRTSAGAVLAFGVIGLGMQQNKTTTYVRIESGDASAEFMFDGESAGVLRARLARWTSRVSAPAPQAAFSVADELTKLAGLRDSGVLTEEEFQTQKVRLLS